MATDLIPIDLESKMFVKKVKTKYYLYIIQISMSPEARVFYRNIENPGKIYFLTLIYQ